MNSLSNYRTSLGSITLASRTTLRNLGVIFDQNVPLDSHIKHFSKTALFHLWNIAKIRQTLSQKDAVGFVHDFVTSRLDYCPSILCLSKSLKTLQLIQNAAAHVLTRTNIRDHISPIFASQPWLPVKSRIEFKILLPTYKALNDQAPYPKELILPNYPTRILWSQDAGLLVVLQVSKVEWEVEPLAIKLLSFWTLSIFTHFTHIQLSTETRKKERFSLLRHFPYQKKQRLIQNVIFFWQIQNKCNVFWM